MNKRSSRSGEMIFEAFLRQPRIPHTNIGAKKALATYGEVEVPYGVGEIMRSFSKEYQAARAMHQLYSKVFRDKGDSGMIHGIATSRTEMNRTGTIAIVMAVTALDQAIYRYACEFWHHEDVETEFRNVGFAAKWVSIPLKAENKSVDKNGPAYLQLTALVHARNAIVHPKLGFITAEGISGGNDTEVERFDRVASGLEQTYNDCLNLLR